MTTGRKVNKISTYRRILRLNHRIVQKGIVKMKEKVFSANEVVFREGDLGTCFYQIIEGTAGVYLSYGEADQIRLTEMKPNQYFGEMAVIDAWPRSTTIVAEEELRVIEIPESDLNSYFTEQPDRILALMRQLGNRIRALTDDYDEVIAFLKEKEEADAEKKPGFLDKLKKYLAISRTAKKNAPLYSVESLEKMINFGSGECLPASLSSYNKGDVLFREGEKGLCMYAVHSGSVGIYSNFGTELEKKLTSLYANTFFGEMGMLDNEARSATAVIEEDGTTLERILPENLEELFRTNPMEIDMILRHLSSRLRQLTRSYEQACEKAAEGM